MAGFAPKPTTSTGNANLIVEGSSGPTLSFDSVQVQANFKDNPGAKSSDRRQPSIRTKERDREEEQKKESLQL